MQCLCPIRFIIQPEQKKIGISPPKLWSPWEKPCSVFIHATWWHWYSEAKSSRYLQVLQVTWYYYIRRTTVAIKYIGHEYKLCQSKRDSCKLHPMHLGVGNSLQNKDINKQKKCVCNLHQYKGLKFVLLRRCSQKQCL